MSLEIPSGSITLMHVNTAPPGWTKLTSVDACALRVVTGSITGNLVVGGVQNKLDVLKAHSATFTPVNPPTTVDAVTLTAASLPGHSHRYMTGGGPSALRGNTTAPATLARLNFPGNGGTANPAGSAGAHTHPLSTGVVTANAPTALGLEVQYVDIILVQRQ